MALRKVSPATSSGSVSWRLVSRRNSAPATTLTEPASPGIANRLLLVTVPPPTNWVIRDLVVVESPGIANRLLLVTVPPPTNWVIRDLVVVVVLNQLAAAGLIAPVPKMLVGTQPPPSAI